MRAMSAASRAGFALAAIAGVALFASLGNWQSRRGNEKNDWVAQQAAALQAAPTALFAAMHDSRPVRLRQVDGEGRYRSPLLLLDGQQRDGRVGVRVYGVVIPDHADRALLVDLGWLPLGANRIMPEPTVPDGARSLRGLLGPWPGQGLRAAPNPSIAPGSPPVVLTYLDADEIGRAFGVALYPGVLRLAPDLDYGHARDLVALPNTLPPERHFGYALQWYGLAATVAIVYLVLAWRSRRKP
jgi:surfeit locus 1 family protein